MESKISRFIGIDFGTDFSCVAVYHNGRPEVIVNDQGNRLTPSCIAFTEDTKLIGEEALNQSVRNSLNTVTGWKDMLGKKFDSLSQYETKMKTFKIEKDAKDRPVVSVTWKG